MLSCAGAGGLAQFQARCSFSFAWHIAMHRQAGGAVGVGACGTVATGSVSVSGTVNRELSVCGQCRFLCGQGWAVTLAHAILGARCWLRARPVGPVCWPFEMSTQFLPFGCFSPREEEGRGRRCANWRVGGACAGYGCAVLLLVGGGQPLVDEGILVLTRSFDGWSGRDCERVCVITFRCAIT